MCRACILLHPHTCILPHLHTCILPHLHTCILHHLHTCILPHLHTCILPHSVTRPTPTTYIRASGAVQVTVRDENDNAPRFSRSRYYTTIRENGTAGAVITQLTVTDADVGPNAQVVYRVAGAHRDQFTILDNGTMIATVPLDREVSVCVCVCLSVCLCVCVRGWGLFGWLDGKLRDTSRLVKAEWGVASLHLLFFRRVPVCCCTGVRGAGGQGPVLLVLYGCGPCVNVQVCPCVLLYGCPRSTSVSQCWCTGVGGAGGQGAVFQLCPCVVFSKCVPVCCKVVGGTGGECTGGGVVQVCRCVLIYSVGGAGCEGAVLQV